MTRICENCGSPYGSVVWEGYVHPYGDVAPTYSEWETLYLCNECYEQSKWAKRESV